MRAWTVMQRISWLSSAGWLLFVLLSPWAIYLYVLAQPYAGQLWSHSVEYSFFGYHFVVVLLISAPLAMLLSSLTDQVHSAFRSRYSLLLGLLMLHVLYPMIYFYFNSPYNGPILLTCLIDNLLLWFLTINFWRRIVERIHLPVTGGAEPVEILLP